LATIRNSLRTRKTPKPQKFRFLLDSAFAKPQAFPRLCKKAHLLHAVQGFKMSPQAEDQEIYARAVQENCFVLTINFKDFKKLVKAGKPGIFGIEAQLSNEEIDSLVTQFISGKDPKNYLGKAVKI